MTLLRWLGWAAYVSLLAAAVHWIAVARAPDLIMWRVLSGASGGGVNRIVHHERPTAQSRTVVRPSPDLFYSTCAYDVSRTPLVVTTAAPSSAYWSVAFYAPNTDNFFVLNDAVAKGAPASVVLAGPGQVVPQREGQMVVTAPSSRGLVLFRTLIDDETRAPAIDRERRAASCESLL